MLGFEKLITEFVDDDISMNKSSRERLEQYINLNYKKEFAPNLKYHSDNTSLNIDFSINESVREKVLE